MSNEKFDRLCQRLNTRLVEEKSITDEQIDFYMRSVLSMVQQQTKAPSSFYTLSQSLIQYWHMGAPSKRQGGRQGFMLGAMWAGAMMIKFVTDEQRMRQQAWELHLHHKDDFLLLKLIDEKPGIQQKELAALWGKSPSALSQWMRRHRDKKYITEISMGREKYYYLEHQGKYALREATQANERFSDGLINIMTDYSMKMGKRVTKMSYLNQTAMEISNDEDFSIESCSIHIKKKYKPLLNTRIETNLEEDSIFKAESTAVEIGRRFA
ncbi:winged helix-turn-helix domain-containing protein [Bengtsoniella intestinalis]|uniref:hypothetical protein n=1 Tax=Bengtsoniella intestinalis TaxID=3073143 RepID=UPI00391F89B0